jgi:hypothetical protein
MASLETIVNQCISYDKDLWKGPVGKDGKVSRTPLANAPGALGSASSNPYDALANLLFNKHLNHWCHNCVHVSWSPVKAVFSLDQYTNTQIRKRRSDITLQMFYPKMTHLCICFAKKVISFT